MEDISTYYGFTELVRNWGAAKYRCGVASGSGVYSLYEERRMWKEADELFARVCDAAAKRFPGRRTCDSPNERKETDND